MCYIEIAIPERGVGGLSSARVDVTGKWKKEANCQTSPDES